MRKLRLLIPVAVIAAMLLLMILPAGALAAPDEKGARPRCVQWHYVRRGQTLSMIARWYHTSVPYLRSINYIPNPNRIYAGTYLCVRTAYPKPLPPPKPPPKPGPHPGPGPGPHPGPGPGPNPNPNPNPWPPPPPKH
jgi:hypothetical protein